MKRYICFLVLFVYTSLGFNFFAQKTLNEYLKKGSNLFVIANCNDSINYGEQIKFEIVKETEYNIVNNRQDADLILKVHSWCRPQVAGIIRDFYVIIELPDGTFLWRSPIEHGVPTAFNGYDYTKSSVDKLVNKILNNIVKKNKDIKPKNIDLLGKDYIDESTYIESQNNFFLAIHYSDNYEIDKALKELKESIKKNPYNAYAYRLQAILYYKNNKFDNAIKSIEKAMQLDPYNGSNDSIYLAAKLEKNNRFMNRIQNVMIISHSLNTINLVFNNSTKHVEKSESDTPSERVIENKGKGEICSFCQGTGVSPTPTSSVSFADSGDEWCEVCKKWVNSGHGYHDKCPSCNGKGYIIKLKIDSSSFDNR